MENVFYNLERKNLNLRLKLTHDQLKHDNYHAEFDKSMILSYINEYKKCKSFFKTSSKTGIDQNVAMNWYIQGQLENPKFRGFYLIIKSINDNDDVSSSESDDLGGEYIISEYGDGWSYKTFVNGEKIFLIANELDDLKKKVKAKGLPLD